jgi:transcription antitermination factor NusG
MKRNLVLEAEDKATMTGWYAVYTKPRTEKKLNDALRQKGIESFLPLIQIKKKWSDRFKLVLTPLFTSYIFVRIAYEKESLKVLNEPNAMNFVFFAGKPALIENNDMELIKLFLEEYPEKIKIQQNEKLKKGNQVLIQSGPFAGRRAVIEKIKNNYKVVLNLPLLNRVISIEVKKEDIGFLE